MDREKRRRIFRKYRYRIIAVIIALVFALITLIFGFGQTLFTLLAVGIGYCIGAYLDGDLDLDPFR